MINKYEKLVEDIKSGNISEQDAAIKMNQWSQKAYQMGMKVGVMKPKQWDTLCETCGKYVFPLFDEDRLDGITVIKGECPRCHNTGTLIPVRDWMYAAGVPGVLWD